MVYEIVAMLKPKTISMLKIVLNLGLHTLLALGHRFGNRHIDPAHGSCLRQCLCGRASAHSGAKAAVTFCWWCCAPVHNHSTVRDSKIQRNIESYRNS